MTGLDHRGLGVHGLPGGRLFFVLFHKTHLAYSLSEDGENMRLSPPGKTGSREAAWIGKRFGNQKRGLIFFRYSRRNRATVTVALTTSAMGKLHHTLFTLPLRLSRYATGSSANSWRNNETMVE